MALGWLTLFCLASTWMVVSGYYFWPPFGVRREGFYDDPCGPTLYRLRAQGAPDLPNSIFIPPPRGAGARRRRPSQAGPPAAAGNRTSSDVAVIPPQSGTPPPPRRTRPPARRPRPARPTTPRPRYPPYPQFRDPFNRPIDPWLALALDLDPLEYPDTTTLTPPLGSAPPLGEALTGSARLRRIQRQAEPVGSEPPVPAPSAPARRPARPAARPAARRPAARRPAGRFAPVECYCDSHWDCNGAARKRGGRYDPQCDNGFGLVCCCR